jgi:hypothetical protein
MSRQDQDSCLLARGSPASRIYRPPPRAAVPNRLRAPASPDESSLGAALSGAPNSRSLLRAQWTTCAPIPRLPQYTAMSGPTQPRPLSSHDQSPATPERTDLSRFRLLASVTSRRQNQPVAGRMRAAEPRGARFNAAENQRFSKSARRSTERPPACHAGVD